MASQALRTIAVAYRPIKAGETPSMEQAEKDLTMLGLSGIIDPRGRKSDRRLKNAVKRELRPS